VLLPVTPLYQANCRKRGFSCRAGMNPCPNNTDANQIYIRQHQKKDNFRISERPVRSKAFSFIYPEDENSAKLIIITNFKYPSAAKDLNRIVNNS
jgi:hypothetical protein